MEGQRYNMLQLFADGGVFMYPLVLCSLLAVGIIIAKAYTLWVANRKSRRVLDEVRALIQEGRFDEAMELTAATPGPVAAILLSGLRQIHLRRMGSEDVESVVRATGRIELGFLERGLVLLATIANVAPLLGFLGTVAGMISAFGAIALAGQVEAALVASGIKVALLTTAAGLVVAIPVNIGYNYFVTRIDKLIHEMEEGTGTIIALAWDLESGSAAYGRRVPAEG